MMNRITQRPLTFAVLIGALSAFPLELRAGPIHPDVPVRREVSCDESISISIAKELLPLDVRALVVVPDGPLVVVGNRNLNQTI